MAIRRSKAFPLRIASSAICLHSSILPFSARYNIFAANCRHTSVKSSGPFPFKVSTASITSRLFPILCPKGISILVMRATIFLPAFSPMETISFARAMESSTVFINAPLPVFTSKRIPSFPAASFLLIMDTAIRGMLSTVAVTSRSAYNFLSAGARFPDCPITERPVLFTTAKKLSRSSEVCIPGIDSILSTVPPVCPKPRPDIFATFTPQEATIGAMISVVLSPTPPVECLSTFIPSMPDKSTISPECATASVIASVSSSVIP